MAIGERPLIIATTTWNSSDVIEPFLGHVEGLGVDKVLLLDFGSDDGTLDRVSSARWSGLVEQVPFPGGMGLDTSNLMLGIARERYPSGWCLFCDPDEFLAVPAGALGEVAAAESWKDHAMVVLQRRNMTGPRSIVPAIQEGGFLDHLTLRIERPDQRSRAEILEWQLGSPWIFSAIPGKVLVRLDLCSRIGSGDHFAEVVDGTIHRSAGAMLLHYPMRGCSRFVEKVRLAEIDLASNMYPEAGNSWHWKRWVAMRHAGSLEQEYLAQFVPDGEVEAMLATGRLVRDLRCALHRHQ